MGVETEDGFCAAATTVPYHSELPHRVALLSSIL